MLLYCQLGKTAGYRDDLAFKGITLPRESTAHKSPTTYSEALISPFKKGAGPNAIAFDPPRRTALRFLHSPLAGFRSLRRRKSDRSRATVER